MPTAKKMEFKAKLEGVGPGAAWTFLTLPFNVGEVWGSRARLAVKGAINGFAFRSSIFPQGNGTHSMMVNKEMQQGAGASTGAMVRVVLEPDTAPRSVKPPADLRRALGKNTRAKAAFAKLSYSNQKLYVDWIEQAKKPETRAARLEKSLGMLAAGKKLK